MVVDILGSYDGANREMSELSDPLPAAWASMTGAAPAALALMLIGAIAACGCRAWRGASGAAGRADCLPDIRLVDQNHTSVVLSSLKGRPVLVDFIYTSCPGPCLTQTQRMRRVAQRLGPALGSQVVLVSISIDPEHEGPQQLLAYAKAQDADRSGWLFLSGGPADIDAVLADFGLTRQREPDGSLAHLTSVYLVGADGRELSKYNGELLKPDAVFADLERALSRG